MKHTATTYENKWPIHPELTARQQSIVDYVRSEILKKGYGPTTREIGEHLGIASPNGVVSHLKSIARKGIMIQPKRNGRALARAWTFPKG